MLLGHRGRCFDVRVSPSNASMAVTSSEDGTARLWDVQTRTCLQSLLHDAAAEVLRSVFLSPPSTSSSSDTFPPIVTCGSDGLALVWTRSSARSPYTRHSRLSHGSSDQIYVCEPIPDHAQSVLTAADDTIYVWDLISPDCPLFAGHYDALSSSVSFGGERNPSNRAFVFDAKFSPTISHALAVALSDGSVRIQDTRQAIGSGSIMCPRHQVTEEGGNAHVTSVTWGSSGGAVLAALGSGDVAVLDIRTGREVDRLEGRGSTCFGSLLSGENCIVTWNADGCIDIWPGSSGSRVSRTPCLSTKIQGFPIYSCALMCSSSLLICAGGTSGGKSIVGTPVHIIDILRHQQLPTDH